MIEKWEDKYSDVMENEIVTSQQIQRWQDEEIELLRAENQKLRELLQQSIYAMDAITDKVDGTGFSECNEFSNCLDLIDIARAVLEVKP
jgi:hypothetical protein